ncbi:MAG: sugar phosphate nucleotidyltransferase [Bryobacterales bacterium]|nr:sugar phosphate nucleotidyltransferase [Bryobacterales bacterium]
MGGPLNQGPTPGDRLRDRCHAVILAGGSGVRFWPQSRIARPKQLLAPLGGGTLLRQTFDRISAVVPRERVWVLTSRHLVAAVADELPELEARQIVGEPVAKSTAPAIALATALVLREDQDAVVGVFPSDHHIRDGAAYTDLLRTALRAALGGDLIVVGIPPSRPDTGFGYIEFAEQPGRGSSGPIRVARFREKPDLEQAREFVASGRFYWNSGQFFWQAAVIRDEFRNLLPNTWSIASRIAATGAAETERRLLDTYGRCDSISVDRAILERSARVAGFAAPDIGWSDLGSWQALHALLPKDRFGNCCRSPASAVDSTDNYIDVPERQTVLLGVRGLVVVETNDALLVCRREDAQRLGEVTEALAAAGASDLL